MNGFQRRAAVLTTIAGLAFLSLAGVASAGNDHGQGEHHPVTICHRTDSNTNPYVVITVDDDSVHFAGHEGHDGPVWDPTLKAQHIKWGDIIPPTDNDGDKAITPKNWTEEGQAIWNNGCQVTPETTTTTSVDSSTTTLPGVTTTTAPDVTTTTVSDTSTSTLPQESTTVPSPTSTTSLPPETSTVPGCQEECPVTTTTVGQTPSTPPSSATTTSSPGSSTTQPSLSTTVPGGPAPTPPASTPLGSTHLPFTGSNSPLLVLGAFLVLCFGVAGIFVGGKRRA